jgi:hypothetical protein
MNLKGFCEKMSEAFLTLADSTTVKSSSEIKEFKLPEEPVKPVFTLSKRDEKIVQMLEEALRTNSGAILIKANNQDGFEIKRLINKNEALDAIAKIKTGELELA